MKEDSEVALLEPVLQMALEFSILPSLFEHEQFVILRLTDLTAVRWYGGNERR